MMLAEIIKATQKNEVARRATKVPWGWTSTSGIPDSEVSGGDSPPMINSYPPQAEACTYSWSLVSLVRRNDCIPQIS